MTICILMFHKYIIVKTIAEYWRMYCLRQIEYNVEGIWLFINVFQ